MQDDHHRRLERLYRAAPVNAQSAPEIRVVRGEAEVVLTVDPALFHGGGALHGSVLFRILDDAAFFAANSLVDDVLVLTASFHVHFLRPVRKGRVRARGRVVSRTRRLLVAESVAFDERDREVARGSGAFVPGAALLRDLPAYAGPLGEGDQNVTVTEA